MGMLENSKDNPAPHNPKYDGILKTKDFIFAGFAECFPLFTILKALNVTEVDYLSLDIQGPELKVLKGIPFDLVSIKVKPNYKIKQLLFLCKVMWFERTSMPSVGRQRILSVHIALHGKRTKFNHNYTAMRV